MSLRPPAPSPAIVSDLDRRTIRWSNLRTSLRMIQLAGVVLAVLWAGLIILRELDESSAERIYISTGKQYRPYPQSSSADVIGTAALLAMMVLGGGAGIYVIDLIKTGIPQGDTA